MKEKIVASKRIRRDSVSRHIFLLSIKAGLQTLKQRLAAAKTAIGRPNENEHKASKEAGANFRRIARVRSTKLSVYNR